MRRTAKVLLAAAALTALAGCGSGAVSYSQPAGMYNVAGYSATFSYPLSVKVAIHDNGFSPALLRVPVNTTIDWVNDGSRDHGVTWTGGNSPNFQSGPLAPGQSFAIRMDGDGPVTYTSGKFNGTIQIGHPLRPKL